MTWLTSKQEKELKELLKDFPKDRHDKYICIIKKNRIKREDA